MFQCWGSNTSGQLGFSDLNLDFVGSSPGEMGVNLSPIDLPFAVKEVHLGYTDTCALSTDGRCLCWGGSAFGALGNGGISGQMVDFGVGFNATALSSGSGDMYHRFALSQNAPYVSLRGWGRNHYGQLGIGNADDRNYAVPFLLNVAITMEPTTMSPTAPTAIPTTNPTLPTTNPTPLSYLLTVKNTKQIIQPTHKTLFSDNLVNC